MMPNKAKQEASLMFLLNARIVGILVRTVMIEELIGLRPLHLPRVLIYYA
jgi:hypothetical protein